MSYVEKARTNEKMNENAENLAIGLIFVYIYNQLLVFARHVGTFQILTFNLQAWEHQISFRCLVLLWSRHDFGRFQFSDSKSSSHWNQGLWFNNLLQNELNKTWRWCQPPSLSLSTFNGKAYNIFWSEFIWKAGKPEWKWVKIVRNCSSWKLWAWWP